MDSFSRILVVLLVIGLPTARALADGIPTTDTLVYSGVAFGAGGAVLAGVPVNVSLWDLETSGTTSTNKKCEAAAPAQTDTQGRFRVSLAGCVTAVSQNANLFAEVSVSGVPLARTRLGAAPYAVEALRSATTSQILTGMTTITVNPAGGAQFTSFDAAWLWALSKVVRGKLTIQLANGTYDLNGPLGYELGHPDGQNISIIGNTSAPQTVILNAPNGIRLDQSRLAGC